LNSPVLHFPKTSASPISVREVRWALHRRQQELQIARAAAKESLRNELADTVTALLLSGELTLRAPNLEVDA